MIKGFLVPASPPQASTPTHPRLGLHGMNTGTGSHTPSWDRLARLPKQPDVSARD